MCDWSSAAEVGWARSFVSSEYKSWLSSWKELPRSCRDCDNLFILSRQVLCACGVRSWWTVCSLVSLVCASISYRDTKRLTSGPATIHLRSADGSSVSPLAPPSALIVALTCSWAWSMAKAEKCWLVLWTTKLPALNSCARCGCILSRVSMSLRWIGSHLS